MILQLPLLDLVVTNNEALWMKLVPGSVRAWLSSSTLSRSTWKPSRLPAELLVVWAPVGLLCYNEHLTRTL